MLSLSVCLQDVAGEAIGDREEKERGARETQSNHSLSLSLSLYSCLTYHTDCNGSQRAGNLKVDNRRPNLVNLNEDPQLSETLLYILKDGEWPVGVVVLQDEALRCVCLHRCVHCGQSWLWVT